VRLRQLANLWINCRIFPF